MHFCIQFSDRFWIGFGMDFLPEFQMFHNARTLKKSISHWFLQCLVKVALFTTLTETIDQVLWNAKKKPPKIDEKSIKNRPQIGPTSTQNRHQEPPRAAQEHSGAPESPRRGLRRLQNAFGLRESPKQVRLSSFLSGPQTDPKLKKLCIRLKI